jgi:hypothetical protein
MKLNEQKICRHKKKFIMIKKITETRDADDDDDNDNNEYDMMMMMRQKESHKQMKNKL